MEEENKPESTRMWKPALALPPSLP